MKKLLSICLSLFLLFSLTACGSLDFNPSGGDNGGSGSNGDGYVEGGAEGFIGDTLHTYWFDFTVDDAYATQQYESYTAEEGYRLIVATITVRNTWTKSVYMWDTDFVIEWQEGGDYYYDYCLPAFTDEQFPEEYPLSVNESITCVAVYEVPALDSFDYDIGFMELFESDEDEDGEVGDYYFVYFTAQER